MTGGHKEPQPLKALVQALEGKGSTARGDQVLNALAGMGIEPRIQRSRWPEIRNIIIDFSPEPGSKHIIFSAHYDAVKNSPGANDNASGVAVLLGLCRKLQGRTVPVRVIFFDREESWFRTPLLRLGLLGSLYYVCHERMQNIEAAYNLEFCGLGDFLGIWPVKDRQQDLPALRQAELAAARIGLPHTSVHVPWVFLSSDHLSFRLRSMTNALTLSLFPKEQINSLETFVKNVRVRKLLSGQRPALPEPLNRIHSPEDTSDHITERSLNLMLALLLEIIHNYSTGSQ